MKYKLSIMLAVLTVGCIGCGDGSSSSGDDGDGGVGSDLDGDADGDGDSDGDGDTDGDTDEGLCPGDDLETERPEHWTRESHCSRVDIGYDVLFVSDKVHRIDITVSAEDYQATMSDLADKLGGGGPGMPVDSGEDPIYVPVTFELDGLVWEQVGMRYKGNSSLHSAWQSGTKKLAFRLNFEKYEDEHPELANQRFYGFEKMTFSNGFKDSSLIRDKTAADIFRAAGIPVARSAFAAVHLDFGEGPVYMGLYTMIEDPSDEMLEEQFDDKSGNLYKPEGTGAQLRTFVEEHFYKKTNEIEADFSDVIGLIGALNADRSDAAAWRAGLEEVFDVERFLTLLALNQAMVNWDSYGFMSHNYYLYADPSDGGRIVFFPWDLNEALLAFQRPGADPTEVMCSGVSAEWPLIRHLLDDSTYRAAYEEELEAALEGAFAVDSVHGMIDAYHDLIAPFVVGPEETEVAPYTFLGSAADFTGSVSTGKDALKPHVTARHTDVKQALGI